MFRVEALVRYTAKEHYLEADTPAEEMNSAASATPTALTIRRESSWLASLCSFPSPQPSATPTATLPSLIECLNNELDRYFCSLRVAVVRARMQHLCGGRYVMSILVFMSYVNENFRRMHLHSPPLLAWHKTFLPSPPRVCLWSRSSHSLTTFVPTFVAP